MNKILKCINGKKTYAGIALGAAGVLCPALGAPVLVCNIVAGLGGLLALVGAQHKNAKLLDALSTGRDMALQLDTIRNQMGMK